MLEVVLGISVANAIVGFINGILLVRIFDHMLSERDDYKNTPSRPSVGA
jgi:hypothetical protein